MASLEEEGVSTRQGTHAVHVQKYYTAKYTLHAKNYPCAYAADRLSISLPLYPQMTETEQKYVVKSIIEAEHG